MSEPPRDPLAEHPIAPNTPRRSSGTRATLDLFPAAPEATPRERPAPEASSFREPPPGAEAETETEVDAEEPRTVAFARRVAAGLADLLILALVGAVELAAGALLLDLRFPPGDY